jgi:hypothetical protein
MFYKPTYCCNCAEKIERAKWGIIDSRRFCDVCSSEFVAAEWIPRAVVAFGIIGLIFSLGVLLRRPEKPLSVTTAQSGVSTNAPQSQKAQQLLSNTNVQQNSSAGSLNTANNSATQAQKTADPKSLENLRLQTGAKSAADKQNSPAEAVYFCGAQTKKGTPCSRKVKGGGRCWQHEGQAAMLSPEKLLINQ